MKKQVKEREWKNKRNKTGVERNKGNPRDKENKVRGQENKIF